MDATTQERLLERARGGDPEALDGLLKAAQPQLYRYSMKMCRHPEDAEDVLQDALIALARSVRDLRDGASFSTWLYTVTRSFCIKKRRRRKDAPSELEPLDAHPLASPEPGPHARAANAEVWEQVRAAIARLDPGQREVLVLRDVEGLTAPEVAAVVGISVAAVKSRLHRARAELRERLAREPYVRRAGCPDIRDVFSRHLEGEISADTCSRMEAHVAGCPACAAECHGLREVLSACSGAPKEVPVAVQQRVQRALREALGRPRAGL